MTIQLGDRVRDRISGLEGIVIGVTEWLWQCRRPIVQPTTLTPDGKPVDSQSFDEPQLEVIEAAAFEPVEPPSRAVSAKTGGPRVIPAWRTDPTRR